MNKDPSRASSVEKKNKTKNNIFLLLILYTLPYCLEIVLRGQQIPFQTKAAIERVQFLPLGVLASFLKERWWNDIGILSF